MFTLFEIYVREPNLIVDKIILTQDENYVPEGIDQEETAVVASAVVSLSSNDLGVSVSPNPFTDNLQISSIEQVKSVSISNMCGSVVYQSSDVSLNENISLSNLTTGFYILKIETTEGQIIAGKIVKQ